MKGVSKTQAMFHSRAVAEAKSVVIKAFMVIQTYRVHITVDLIFRSFVKMTKKTVVSLGKVAISAKKLRRFGQIFFKFLTREIHLFTF